MSDPTGMCSKYTPTDDDELQEQLALWEMGCIIDSADQWNAWNVNANPWSFLNNSCSQQSAALMGYLQQQGYQNWGISQISGGDGFPIPNTWEFTQNDVLASPINGNGMDGFTLDPEAGNSFFNSSGQVPVGSVNDFNSAYPYKE